MRRKSVWSVKKIDCIDKQRLVFQVISQARPHHISFLSHSHPSTLQHQIAASTPHNHINLLSPNQHHYFRLNHFRIHVVDNKFEKTN
jgi:hypothetical protein